MWWKCDPGSQKVANPLKAENKCKITDVCLLLLQVFLYIFVELKVILLIYFIKGNSAFAVIFIKGERHHVDVRHHVLIFCSWRVEAVLSTCTTVNKTKRFNSTVATTATTATLRVDSGFVRGQRSRTRGAEASSSSSVHHEGMSCRCVRRLRWDPGSLCLCLKPSLLLSDTITTLLSDVFILLSH